MSDQQFLRNGEHFQLFQDIPTNDLSSTMHSIGRQIGTTTFELGLLGYSDDKPARIHSESIYHSAMCPYFMLACVQKADIGGDTLVYDAEKAARIISSEAPELEGVRMVYHAEHYDHTRAETPLIRDFGEGSFLTFRQQFYLNEVHNLPPGLTEDDFYAYIDQVLTRCIEFDKILEPGEMILINNYKTLHVRKAFEGLRKIIRVRVDDPAYNEI
jgi:alpha-ketoglutarate-dependent taurine dioxygenase